RCGQPDRGADRGFGGVAGAASGADGAGPLVPPPPGRSLKAGRRLKPNGSSAMADALAPRRATELPVQEIDVHTDTRDILAHARQGARKRGFQDWLICDVDAHHVETVSWHELVEYIEDPVIRHQAMLFHKEKLG